MNNKKVASDTHANVNMKIQWRLRISDLNYGNFQPFLNKKEWKDEEFFPFRNFCMSILNEKIFGFT